ncbi:hypothetical protein pb186bvf_011347 [Paramecium bursaria]
MLPYRYLYLKLLFLLRVVGIKQINQSPMHRLWIIIEYNTNPIIWIQFQQYFILSKQENLLSGSSLENGVLEMKKKYYLPPESLFLLVLDMRTSHNQNYLYKFQPPVSRRKSKAKEGTAMEPRFYFQFIILFYSIRNTKQNESPFDDDKNQGEVDLEVIECLYQMPSINNKTSIICFILS